ncbi:MAG: hypothetical protein IJR99_11665 [Kiritimatiellae bacterium]|nr:hypothetical protein [Kiritimatiellia bacterium]
MNRQMGMAMTVAFLAVVAGTLSAGGVTWSPTATGTYSWADPDNWGGTLPTTNDTVTFGALSGNQTIDAPEGSVAGLLDVLNGRSGSLYVRTLTGTLTTCSNVFRTGTTVLKGRLDVTGTDETYTRIGTSQTFSLMATLDVADGGVLCATNDHAVVLGYNNGGSSGAAAGRLILRDGGELYLGGGRNASMSGLMLGRGDGNGSAIRLSSYFQEGGYARITRFVCGFEKNTRTGMTIAGGVLELPYSSDTRFRIAHLGCGVFQQLGGEIFVNTNKAVTSVTGSTPSESFEVGGGGTSDAGRLPGSVYLCGGTFTCGDVISIQGQQLTPAESVVTKPAPYADFTVDGDAEVSAASVRMGVNRGSGAAILNLNGGRLSVRYVRRASASHLGPREVNGNGGTLHTEKVTNDHEYHFAGIDRILLYSKGLTVQSDVPMKLGLEDDLRPLRTAKGYGVESVSVTSGLTGCYEPPLVTLEGGSGSNATAVALIDYSSNQLTNVVVTCRGEGYAADDVLTVKLLKGDSTAAAVTATVTLTPNTPGTFVKTGTNRLVLYAQPDFDGTYEVRQGLLLQSSTADFGSTNVAAVVVGGTNASFQCGTGNARAIEANWNPVNTNAALTLGTEYGPGTLTIPSGADAKPYEQTFASLAVNGKGNVISFVNTSSVGFKLSFGTVSCAQDAEVTIPRWDSQYKVYVTGMPEGSHLRGVVFNGTDRFAMVGPGGQLIPARLGTVISVR